MMDGVLGETVPKQDWEECSGRTRRLCSWRECECEVRMREKCQGFECLPGGTLVTLRRSVRCRPFLREIRGMLVRAGLGGDAKVLLLPQT